MCRVLVVDDDPTVLGLCLFALEFEGHEAVGCTDLATALATARREAFDVVVADLPSEEESDRHLVELTAHTGSTAPLLLLGKDALRLLHTLITLPAVTVYGLVKPFDLGEFVDEVQRLAQQRAR
jgi:two-component system response regulator MprA